jgi:hypothetical protein
MPTHPKKQMRRGGREGLSLPRGFQGFQVKKKKREGRGATIVCFKTWVASLFFGCRFLPTLKHRNQREGKGEMEKKD